MAPSFVGSRGLPPIPRTGASGHEGTAIRGKQGDQHGDDRDDDRFTPADDKPVGKLADAELHFAGAPLGGFQLLGFAIGERRTGAGGNVTLPARQYIITGERRSFALLRPIADPAVQDRFRDLLLKAFTEYEERRAIAG